MYPVSLDIDRKLCVVIGGGSVAERKVKGLLESGAFVRVISPKLTEELVALVQANRVEWCKKSYTPDDLERAFLIFAATDNRDVQELICRQAEENGQLVNIADDPECCNFHVPASIRRGDLTLTVSTRGTSPAVAALIRQKLEKDFGTEYETLLDIMSLVRQHAGFRFEGLSQADRKKIYKKILHNDIIEWIKSGQTDKLQAHVQGILGADIDLDINKL